MQRIIYAFAVVALYPLLFLASSNDTASRQNHAVDVAQVTSALVLGLPSTLLCLRQHWYSIWPALAFGVLAGILAALLVSYPDIQAVVVFIGPAAVMGGVHGVAFWLLGFWRNSSLKTISPHANSQAVG